MIYEISKYARLEWNKGEYRRFVYAASSFGQHTTLNARFDMIRERVAMHHPAAAHAKPIYRDFRPGDVRHSLADIDKARRALGYDPAFNVASGLDAASAWYVRHLRAA